MGTQKVHKKGVLPWLVHWARHAGTRDVCPALAALAGQVQKFLFLTVHYFTSLVRITQQPVVPRRLSIYVCLWAS